MGGHKTTFLWIKFKNYFCMQKWTKMRKNFIIISGNHQVYVVTISKLFYLWPKKIKKNCIKNKNEPVIKWNSDAQKRLGMCREIYLW